MDITKADAKRLLGIETDADLGRWFNDEPTKQAVGNWPDDEPLPPGRQWELRARRPDLFPQRDVAA